VGGAGWARQSTRGKAGYFLRPQAGVMSTEK